MARKRRLEAAEAIITPDLNPPVLMSDEDYLFWYGLLLEKLEAARSANAPIQTAPARREEDKSEDRRDFDNMIFRIADRLRNAPPSPIPPLVLSHMTNPGSCALSAPVPANDDSTASELLKALRRKLGLER
ncbi:MAG TPA: hypothetical protein VF297_00790 [Pyrinomonadaceae bacterium]